MQKKYQEGYAKAFQTRAGQQGRTGRRHRARPEVDPRRPTTRRRTCRCGWTPLLRPERRQRAQHRLSSTCSPARASPPTSSRPSTTPLPRGSTHIMSNSLRRNSLTVSIRLRARTTAGDGAPRASSPVAARPGRRARTGASASRSRSSPGRRSSSSSAFVIFPVVLAAYYGFFSWKGFGPPTDFVGLDNYFIDLRTTRRSTTPCATTASSSCCPWSSRGPSPSCSRSC